MSKILKCSCILMALVMTVSLAGCGSVGLNTTKYNTKAQFYSLDMSVVSENEKHQLIWNDATGDISFKSKETGVSWSTRSLRNDGDVTEINVSRHKTPIIVDYVEKGTFLDKVENAYISSINKGTYSAKQIENGIKVTYYFSEAELSVPVYYTLTDEGFNMYIKPKELGENGNRICSISFMPFMASVNNNANADENYLFVPSGSGALIYPKTTDDGAAISVSDPVYGNDAMNGQSFKTKQTDIKLPVFGAKVGNNAICGIINNGADNAEIETIVGSETDGYSTVYPTFKVRGDYSCVMTVMKSESEGKVYSDGIIGNRIGVLYIPLNGENANYVGMANTYRDYLTKKGKLEKSNNDNLLNIKFIGGLLSRKFAFGVPYNELNVLTDFDDVVKISKELNKEYSKKINIDLLGYSKTGYTLGKIAGGYKYNKKFGNINQINTLPEKDFSLFFDFDILRFSDSGKGISKRNAALNVSKQQVPLREQDFVTFSKDLSSDEYFYVSRDELVDIMSKSISSLQKWKINGIGLASLSNTSYSDYTGYKYVSKSYMSSQVEALMKNAQKAKLNIASSNANDYAANLSTHIYDVPTTSKAYQFFDCEVPFYQIVYKGYKSMSVSSLNLTDNKEKEFLKAIESGLGLTYTIIDDYDSSLINSRDNIFYNSEYDNVKSLIKEHFKEYSDIFELIGIANHINTFQPDVLCIGGGISNEGDTLINPIKEFVKGENFARNVSKQTEIKVAALGNDAGIIGAAFLADLYK